MELKELEDFDWFPSVLRKYQMEFIGFLSSQFGFYAQVAQMIRKDLKEQKISKITDLCSGSGLPAIYIQQNIDIEKLQTTLTDKFPQCISLTPGVHYVPHSVDILNVKMEKDSYYTMYNAFHHFNADEQQKIIQNALDSHTNLKIVEIVQPTLLNAVLVTLASTLGVWLFCPFIRPFEWRRILFTYFFPVNVLTVLTDGYITILKSKSEKQYRTVLRQMFRDENRIKLSSHWRFPVNLLTIKVTPDYV